MAGAAIPVRCADPLGRHLADQIGKRVKAPDASCKRAEARPPLREYHVQHGRQQQGVRARAYCEMLIRRRGRLRAAGVDDDHAPASCPNVGEPPPHVRRAHQAAVRRQRIRAENQEEVGPVEVGHRNQREVPEHAQRDQHLRQLVGGAGGVDVAGPQRAREGEQVGDSTPGCGRRGCRSRRRPRRGRGAAARGAVLPPRSRGPPPSQPLAMCDRRGQAASGGGPGRDAGRRGRPPSGRRSRG